jgi:hypothetical protein
MLYQTGSGAIRNPTQLNDEAEPVNIGKYGRLRANYLKQYRKVTYYNLLTTGNLDNHLVEINQTAKERYRNCAVFTKSERLVQLNQVAITQLTSLFKNNFINKLSER